MRFVGRPARIGLEETVFLGRSDACEGLDFKKVKVLVRLVREWRVS